MCFDITDILSDINKVMKLTWLFLIIDNYEGVVFFRYPGFQKAENQNITNH